MELATRLGGALVRPVEWLKAPDFAGRGNTFTKISKVDAIIPPETPYNLPSNVRPIVTRRTKNIEGKQEKTRGDRRRQKERNGKEGNPDRQTQHPI
jgi:hypothetical protein